tara:strand:- start:48 stop:437 length:390 start_codon:yes stop_codon:yes gene_type:complete
MKKGFGNDDYQGIEYVLNGKSKTKTGSIHPEIGKLRLKYLIKDMKLFKKYGVKQFYRDPYKNELELYPDAGFNHIKGGKSACTAMCCIKLNYETRAAVPMTKEDVIKHEMKNNNEIQLVKDQTLNRDAD